VAWNVVNTEWGGGRLVRRTALASQSGRCRSSGPAGRGRSGNCGQRSGNSQSRNIDTSWS
jgi:hypothetical protein